MLIKRTLQVKIRDSNETINFGIPNSEKEIDDVFRFRWQEYSLKKYIDPDRYPDHKEKDEYDISNKCVYFATYWKDKIIGTIRLIKDNPLPTEIDFDFKEPTEIADIKKDKRVEFGRFIIIPPDKDKGLFIPRGMAMLVMFDVLLDYCEEHDLLGGYAFVKSDLYSKMRRANMPIIVIKDYKSRYPRDGVLYNYFNQADNPVIPIAFRTDSFKKYIRGKLNNRLIFDHKNENIILKNNLFMSALRVARLI